MADQTHGKTLFIRNLPYSTTNEQLEEVFSNIGPLKSCFVVSEKESGKCRGFGYVKFTILEDAKSALQSVKKINGRQVHLQYAKKKEKKKRFGVPKIGASKESEDTKDEPEQRLLPFTVDRQSIESEKALEPPVKKTKTKKKSGERIVPVKGQQQAPNPRNEGKRARLIVRNLSFQCSPEDLKKTFSTYGTIEDVHIPQKGQGKKLGFGFVQFSTKAQAGMAISGLNGKDIKGRVVAVDWALPKSIFENKRTETKTDEEAMEVEDFEQVPGVKKDGGDEEHDKSESDEEEEEDEDSSDEEDEGDSEDVEDDNSGSSDDDNDNENNEKKKQLPERESDVNQGRTVFIRNLPFSAEEENIEEVFSQYGDVKYARIVMDNKTGMSKGSAFVQFSLSESAEVCLSTANSSGESGGGISLGGRPLYVTLAVSKQQAGQLAEKKDKKKEEKDSRNLYLAREGMIRPGTEAAKEVPAADLAKRVKIDATKRTRLRDQNMFVSSVRLCLHNIPATIVDSELRKVVLKSAGDKLAKLTECRIMRDLNRVNSEGQGKSRGYAFCAFTQHQHALAALRHLNNNPDIFGDKKRPIVEFSIENRKALETKQKRVEKSRIKLQHKPSFPKKLTCNQTQDKSISDANGTANRRKRKRSSKNVKDSKPLETRKAQDKVARSLHKGPLGLPKHSGAKQRHKNKTNQMQKSLDTKMRKGHLNKRDKGNKKEKLSQFKSSNKKRKETDNFDRLVASYKSKIMKSAVF